MSFGLLQSCSDPARPSTPGLFATIEAGSQHNCALVTSGETYCWGRNFEHELGTGLTNTHDSLPALVDTPVKFASVNAGTVHTCALTAEGAAYCWGHGFFGRLGSDVPISATPMAVQGQVRLNTITLGEGFTCGLTDEGAAYCWGDNRAGQLGRDTTVSSSTTPIPVDGGRTFVAIAAGDIHTCALTNSGAAYCWGSNLVGQVGSGDTARTIMVPAQVAGNHVFTAIASGSSTTCAITRTSEAYCWGYGQFGQLGTGRSMETERTPARVSDNRSYRAISVGGSHACGLTVDYALYCWGANDMGQLAGRTGERCTIPNSDTVHDLPCTTSPTASARGHSFRTVSAGEWHTCALDSNAAAYCWGRNALGQGGKGPTRIRDPL
jgi:alpha-tubulin suppressor-like RCC1 family protein